MKCIIHRHNHKEGEIVRRKNSNIGLFPEVQNRKSRSCATKIRNGRNVIIYVRSWNARWSFDVKGLTTGASQLFTKVLLTEPICILQLVSFYASISFSVFFFLVLYSIVFFCFLFVPFKTYTCTHVFLCLKVETTQLSHQLTLTVLTTSQRLF